MQPIKGRPRPIEQTVASRPTADQVPKVLMNASRCVLYWLREQPNVKEESLTDWLLYDISSQSPLITYTAFSRHVEARETGADWEWWILFSGRSFRFRIQAKKLTQGIDAYASIAKTNRLGLQIDMLIASADRVNALPFYAFYTATPSCTMCNTDSKDEGVFLGGARRIYADCILQGRKQVLPTELLRRTTPLSCLFAWPLTSAARADLSPFLTQFFSQDFLAPDCEVATLQDSRRGLYGDNPEIVESFLGAFVDPSAHQLQTEWEERFFDDTRDINGFMITNLTGYNL